MWFCLPLLPWVSLNNVPEEVHCYFQGGQAIWAFFFLCTTACYNSRTPIKMPCPIKRPAVFRVLKLLSEDYNTVNKPLLSSQLSESWNYRQYQTVNKTPIIPPPPLSSQISESWNYCQYNTVNKTPIIILPATIKQPAVIEPIVCIIKL